MLAPRRPNMHRACSRPTHRIDVIKAYCIGPLDVIRLADERRSASYHSPLTPQVGEAWAAALCATPGKERTSAAAELLAAGSDALRVTPWTAGGADMSGSLLHAAAEQGDVELIQLFLQTAGSAIAAIVDEDGQSALHVAVLHGHVEAARALMVEHWPGYGCAELLLYDNYRMTPFHLACEGGDPAMVELILAELATQPKLTPEAVAELKRGSAIFLARRGNHKEVVGMLESLRDSACTGSSSRTGSYRRGVPSSPSCGWAGWSWRSSCSTTCSTPSLYRSTSNLASTLSQRSPHSPARTGFSGMVPLAPLPSASMRPGSGGRGLAYLRTTSSSATSIAGAASIAAGRRVVGVASGPLSKSVGALASHVAFADMGARSPSAHSEPLFATGCGAPFSAEGSTSGGDVGRWMFGRTPSSCSAVSKASSLPTIVSERRSSRGAGALASLHRRATRANRGVSSCPRRCDTIPIHSIAPCSPYRMLHPCLRPERGRHADEQELLPADPYEANPSLPRLRVDAAAHCRRAGLVR